MSGAELPPLPSAKPRAEKDRQTEELPEGRLARVAAACTRWSERWIPDAFVFALIATVIAVAAALSTGIGPMQVAKLWGDGFWELLTSRSRWR